jgi:hypothetical protein
MAAALTLTKDYINETARLEVKHARTREEWYDVLMNGQADELILPSDEHEVDPPIGTPTTIQTAVLTTHQPSETGPLNRSRARTDRTPQVPSPYHPPDFQPAPKRTRAAQPCPRGITIDLGDDEFMHEQETRTTQLTQTTILAYMGRESIGASNTPGDGNCQAFAIQQTARLLAAARDNNTDEPVRATEAEYRAIKHIRTLIMRHIHCSATMQRILSDDLCKQIHNGHADNETWDFTTACKHQHPNAYHIQN